MIAAAIDIGTNTTLALLAERDAGGALHPLKDQLTVNRLGDALKNGPVLPPDILSLNIDLLAEIVRDFRRAGAEDFIAAGTSALRRSQNRLEFVQAAQEIAGLRVEIIPGRDEAALTYLGAVSNRELFPNEQVCVMDLGGGSTEIIEGKGFSAGQGYSIDVGSIFLTNEFFADDPPTVEQVARLREHLRGRLPQLVAPLRGQKVPWYFVGGTAVTLAILKAGLRRYEPEKIGGSVLSKSDAEKLIFSFSGKSSDELQGWPGMPSGRGRSIMAGAILLDEMLAALAVDEGMVSERGLRHGLWLAKFGEGIKQ